MTHSGHRPDRNPAAQRSLRHRAAPEPHACCGVVSNGCCDVSAPGGAVLKLSAAPPPPGAWYLTAPTSPVSTAVPLATSTAFSGARSRRTCPCRPQPNTSWWSTWRPPGRSASTCHRRCSRAPTRWSN